mmetsp:Transcript_59101/g.171370  ORF Transcript_59101/g.171370 Transcript_59101/m.171370 type:complete len:376 (-) Transcript_59101:10-1137(-)
MTRLLVLLLVVLSGSPQGSDAYHDADNCLTEFGNNTDEIATCFRGFQGGPYAQCFNDTGIAAFQECMDADPGVADPWECGGVMMCAYETYLAGAQAYLDSMGGLDECIQASILEFMQCGMANLASCGEPCGGLYTEELSTLFPSISPASVSTCDGFQTEVADMSCGPASCCSSCVGGLDSVLECVSNTVYQLECDLTCTGDDQVVSPAGTRNRILSDGLLNRLSRGQSSQEAIAATRSRALEEEETLDAHVAVECPLSLVNSTTLQSLTTTPALFMDCVALHYLWMFTAEGMEYVMGAGETVVSGTETPVDGEADTSGATSASSDGETSEGEADTAGATSASSPSLSSPGYIVGPALLMMIVSAVLPRAASITEW